MLQLRIVVDCTFTFHHHAVLELHCEREVIVDRLVVSGCTTNRPAVILCSFEQQPPTECKAYKTLHKMQEKGCTHYIIIPKVK